MTMRLVHRLSHPTSAVLLLVMLAFITSDCKKIEPERLILIRTGSVSAVTQTSCSVSATLYDVGGGSGVSQHGFSWAVTDDLSAIINNTNLGSRGEKGNFSGQITGLSPGTTYYVWAYASKGDHTEYGNSQSFQTSSVAIPTLETQAVGEITSTSGHSGGIISSDGGATITLKGVCWSTSPTPTTGDFTTENGSGTGEYGSDMTGLNPSTTYFVRAYAVNSAGTGYGNQVEFTTLGQMSPPVVTTNPVEEQSWNYAVGGGNVISEGGSEITERGLCWGQSPNPTKADYSATSPGGIGEFNVEMTNLLPNTEYFVRAYAINSIDIAYGDDAVFSTLPEPVEPSVVTYEVTLIEYTGATCGGSITSDGGAPVIAKGLCWSTSPNPTVAGPSLEYGAGSDPFTMEISDLDHNTEYYVRAYATNSAGKTGYGNQVTFATLFLCGSQLVDPRDGKTYFTVSIGEQCWMAENLNVGSQIASTELQTDNGSIEKYCYENNPDYCTTYGGMYSWDEMMQYTLIESSQGVCPDGWHIPSDLEWKIMERAIGMTVEESDGTSWRGDDEGGKLKTGGTSFWNPPNEGATNSTLFSALPSGMVWNDGSSSGIGDFAVFWTSTPILETQAWYRYLHTDEARIYRVDGFRPNTTTVRCIKD